jgi:DNA-binding Lrp family transcriptional regulator
LAQAYVLINVEPGSEDDVLRKIRSISIVKEAFVSYGLYDLVTRISGVTMEELKETVSHKIRLIDQVRSTLTLVLMEENLNKKRS